MVLYNYTSRTELEVEYHHVRFNGGSLEERTFMWAPTGSTDRSPYGSPNAQSQMRMNSYLVNGIFYLDQRQSGSGWSPYFRLPSFPKQKRLTKILVSLFFFMVGDTGFEPVTSCL